MTICAYWAAIRYDKFLFFGLLMWFPSPPFSCDVVCVCFGFDRPASVPVGPRAAHGPPSSGSPSGVRRV